MPGSSPVAALVGLKNVLLRGALVSSVATDAQGARIARQSARGDVPVELGTKPAPETLKRRPGLGA